MPQDPTFDAGFGAKASLSASVEPKFVVPIEFYKILRLTPITISLSLGANAGFDSEVELVKSLSLIQDERLLRLSKFDTGIALMLYLEGNIGDDPLEYEKEFELFSLKSELEHALVKPRQCRWEECDAIIPIEVAKVSADASTSLQRTLFYNYLHFDDTSEWHFYPESSSMGWELEDVADGTSVILRKEKACLESEVILPEGELFFLAKPFVPPFLIPLSVNGGNLVLDPVRARCPPVGTKFPVTGTDPTSAEVAPESPLNAISVDSTIVCVAVIDEDDNFLANNQYINQETMWARFREEYPTRPFCLLMPPHPTGVDIPENFKSDPNIKYHYDISKVPSKSDDWFELCELSKYASVGSIALFIDDSGSMHEKDVIGSHHRFRERLETLGINLIKVAVDNEVWIEPFLTTLSSGPPCITKTGATGRCLDKCEERGGIPVPWTLGDPEPNCRDFSYQSGVVCCTFEGPPCLGGSGQISLHLETKDLEHAQSNMDPLFRVFSAFGDGHLDFRLSTLGESLPKRAEGEDYIIPTGIPCIDTMLEIEATGTDAWMIGGASIDGIALQSDIWLDGKPFDSSYQGYDYHDRWLLTTLFQKGSYNQMPPTKLDW